MSGRSGSALLAALFLVSLLAPARAQARTKNFFSGSPLGVGILGGLENRPKTDFAAGGQTTSSNYASYFGFEPFLDLGNVCFRASMGWHFYPIVNGAGSDSSGNFTENSDAGSLYYGLRVQLAPFIGKSARSRFYFVLGALDSVVKIKDERKYTSGTHAGTTFSEQLQGSSIGLSGGIGWETFVLQNWSMAFELGYADRGVDTFHYRSGTDTAGNARSGEVAKDSAGNNKGFKAYTPYGQVMFNVNL